MTVALKQGSVLTVIGPGGLLHSFFSTIAVRLENGRWGSRFPFIMNGLYSGSLGIEGARAAHEEMLQIRNELARLPPSAIVWDFEDQNQSPPWGSNPGPHVTHMANYFVTETGRNLVDEILGNIESQTEFGGPLEVVQFNGGFPAG